MENQHSHIESLFEKTGEYFETKAELFKLRAADKSSDLISSVLSRLIIAFFISSCFLLVNIGLAILIGNSLGELYYGFFIVAGFYLVIIALLYSLRNKWLKVPISNLIIKNIFK
ncbi:MAG TPA: hypothetical protein VK718_03510 [Ferruginibacter sp.]|jgi:hypothetical protein|nr:hypothetical protein [Ferruginibacter sp.]